MFVTQALHDILNLNASNIDLDQITHLRSLLWVFAARQSQVVFCCMYVHIYTFLSRK